MGGEWRRVGSRTPHIHHADISSRTDFPISMVYRCLFRLRPGSVTANVKLVTSLGWARLKIASKILPVPTVPHEQKHDSYNIATCDYRLYTRNVKGRKNRDR